MVLTVEFEDLDAGTSVTRLLENSVTLRELQRDLRSAFGKPFPKMQANLVIGDRVFDGFIDTPFSDMLEENGVIEVTVCFCRTTDPFFYDQADRTKLKYTLADEVAYDTAKESGATELSFSEWLRCPARIM